jgi:hypothetical protein
MLADQINLINATESPADLKTSLVEISALTWSLTDRARMHGAYTEHAKQLITASGADKYRTLADLAAICWKSSADFRNIRTEHQRQSTIDGARRS